VVLPALEDVVAARERIDPYLEPTPLVPSPRLPAALKLETVQPTGSFKVRGAFSALTRLAEGTAVVAASAGNHGLGVAYAAETLGLEAAVVCPRTASRAKLEKLHAFPIELVLHGEAYDEAESYARSLAAGGGRYVSAYSDPDVIAGAGTVGLELLEELDGPFTVVAPVGGGGLASGVGLAVKSRPGVRLLGVQSEASPWFPVAVEAGCPVPVAIAPSLADGLSGNVEPGTITFPLLRELADDVLVVTEEDVRQGMRFLHREHGIVAEGAGAIGVGALLAGRIASDAPVVCLVTGRNVTEEALTAVLGSA
jgi:threonine dehydratase